MNKKIIRNYQIFSAIFTAILGTFLHFTYQLSGENWLVGIFSPINESVWEHLKLLFFPMLVTTIIGYFYFKKDVPNFFCSKVMGIVISMIFTVVFFYTYTGVLGKNIDIINIISFFIAVILGELISYWLMINKCRCRNKGAIMISIIIFISFVFFTFNAPKLGIFKDPLTNTYGIMKEQFV